MKIENIYYQNNKKKNSEAHRPRGCGEITQRTEIPPTYSIITQQPIKI